jgi:small subunit ribosomal protein S15
VLLLQPVSKDHKTNFDMYLTSEVKKDIFTEHGKTANDTGSAEGQIALFTFRIQHLTQHLKINRNDLGTERSLVRLVGKRRRLLDYLKEKDITRYREIIKKLNIRK